MNVMLRQRDDVARKRISTIYEIRYKIGLLDQCKYQIDLCSGDPDCTRIMLAAYEQLTGEINQLCWRIGL